MNANIIDEWQALSGVQQHDFIRACVYKAAKREYGTACLYQRGHSVDEYISEVWLDLTENRLTEESVKRVNIERARHGKAPISLVSMIYLSARAVLSSVIRHDRQADLRDGGELDPERQTRTDTIADAITAMDFKKFLERQDSKNQKICELRIEGYTERGIAPEVGISHIAVHHRLTKIKKEMMKQQA